MIKTDKILEAVQKGLGIALNEDLSISPEVEKEAKIIADQIKLDSSFSVFYPFSDELQQKRGSFIMNIFKVPFSVKYQLIYFKTKEQYDALANQINFDSTSNCITNQISINSAVIDGQFIPDFKKYLKHEVAHIYDCFKRNVKTILSGKERDLYELANSHILRIDEDILYNYSKYDLEIPGVLIKEKTVAFGLYISFKAEQIGFLHGYDEEVKQWKTYSRDAFKQSEAYMILCMFDELQHNTAIYEPYIKNLFPDISIQQYLKYVEKGHKYLKEKVGKIIARNYFNEGTEINHKVSNVIYEKEKRT